MDKQNELIRFFFNRTDAVAISGKGWGNPIPYRITDKKTLDLLLQSHIENTKIKLPKQNERNGFYNTSFRVGTYSPDIQGYVRFLAFDIDGGKVNVNHSDPILHPAEAALSLIEKLQLEGLIPYLEKSGSATGWHIWIFFNQPQPASVVRLMASDIVNKIPEKFRMTASGKTKNTIEIFPKQNSPKNFGNMIWLPWWKGAEPGGNNFYSENFKPMYDFKIETSGLKYTPTKEDVKIIRSPDNTDFAKWKHNALTKLQLEKIYGEWLTGKLHGTGFLECRDPASPTGDKNPSSGVYEGNDGEHERGWFYSFRTGEGMDVFDFMVSTNQAKNRKHAILKIAEMTNTKEMLPKKRPKPEIILNTQRWSLVVEQTRDAFIQFNNDPPRFFRNGSNIVQLTIDPILTTEVVNAKTIFGHLHQVADFYKVSTKGEITDAYPPERLAQEILPYLKMNLPVLRRMTSVPVYDKDLNLINNPGFHHKQGIYYIPSKSLSIPDGEISTKDALKALYYITQDFPFASESDKVNWIAALISPFVRDLIDGAMPMLYIEAPTPGSGKSLLAKILSIILSGEDSAMNFLDDKEEERRKFITSTLMKHPDLVVLDNVSGRLDSPAIASVLTATIWEDRILGRNNMITLYNSPQWVLTANNLVISEELTRRMMLVRLEPKSAQPWKNTSNFTIKEPLELFVKRVRGELIKAVLSLIDNWIKQGAKLGQLNIGSYSSWGSIISGIFEANNIDGLMNNHWEMDIANDEKTEWERFVDSWWSEFDNRGVFTYDLLRLCQNPKEPLLAEVRGFGSDRSQAIKLGKALSFRRGKVYSDYQIQMKIDSHRKIKVWNLVKYGVE